MHLRFKEVPESKRGMKISNNKKKGVVFVKSDKGNIKVIIDKPEHAQKKEEFRDEQGISKMKKNPVQAYA